MKVTIRWKLMCSYLLLLLVTGGTLFGYLSHTLEDYLVGGVRENLLSESGLAALMASREIRSLPHDAPQVAADIGRKIRARVTIIATTGEVVGDSEVKPEDLVGLENHRDRPEVRGALHGGMGSAIRYSSTLRTDMLYVAVPFAAGVAKGGVLRLALPLSTVKETTARLHAILGAALALATLLSLILSYILSNVTSRTLRAMAAGAARIGTGDFSRRLPVRTHDELGDLGRVMNEMAERLEAQVERLATDRNRLDAIMRGMGEGLLVIAMDGTITLANPAFCALFALKDDVTGRPLLEITRHPVLNDTFRGVIDAGTEQVAEISFPWEEEKTLLTHWVPLTEWGGVSGVVAVFHDISDLKRLERIRKDFVANVSHELRTPVTVIKGYAETLLRGGTAEDPTTVNRFVSSIHAHAERLARLIGDLLTLSELESTDYALKLVPVSLTAVVRQACALLEPKAAAKEIVLDSGAVPELQVLADQGRLEQVMVNLLDNAVKYTPNGGRVAVTAETAEGMVQVAVSDTGQGIPSSALPRIFERFYRVDAARNREEGGTGLGLSIVKHVVQLHGGSIRVESTPGRGTTVFFTLQKG